MKELWFSVKERLPELPDVPFCNRYVIAYNEGDTKSRPMLYQRSSFRGKTVVQWLTVDGGNTYRIPDYWQPFPKPPKQKKNKGCDSDD